MRWLDTNLENGGWRVEVDDLNVALGSPDYHKRILDIHSIHPFCHSDGSNGIRGSQVPKL